MINIDDIPAIIIHDEQRLDRKEMMGSELPKFFGDKNITTQPAIKDRFAAVAITRVHQACIAQAKQNKYDNVLVMEDDVRFLDGARSWADHLLKYVDMIEEEWDVLLGGVYTLKIDKEAPPGWAKINKLASFSGLHWYIMSERAYDRFLSLDPSRTVHVDRWMGENLNCWCAWPMFAVQYPGYSDQKERLMNYDHLLTRLLTIDNIKHKRWWEKNDGECKENGI
jgi:hypothetical protein